MLISLCFSFCLSHGYLPAALIETTIVPIVKNIPGNLSDCIFFPYGGGGAFLSLPPPAKIFGGAHLTYILVKVFILWHLNKDTDSLSRTRLESNTK